MKFKKIYLLPLPFLVTAFLFAKEYNLKEVQEIGNKVAKEVKKTLKHKVREAKKKGGLEAVAKYCMEESRKDIENIEKKYQDIKVRRVSLHSRNSKNQAAKDEEDILRAFELLAKAGAYMPKSVVQADEEGGFKLYSPIVMNSRYCKKCHGDKSIVDPKLRKIFEKKYPNDKSYGFHIGDLRGAVVVEFPAPKSEN